MSLRGDKSNRLPILVSWKNHPEGKLLLTPVMHDDKGVEMATALTETLSDWNLQSGMVAQVFDTFSSNRFIVVQQPILCSFPKG